MKWATLHYRLIDVATDDSDKNNTSPVQDSLMVKSSFKTFCASIGHINAKCKKKIYILRWCQHEM